MKKPPPRSITPRLLLALAFAAGAAVGCVKPVTFGQTHVGKGELYKTGHDTFDDFFERVHTLQGEAESAADDEKKARAPLSDALGLESASAERLVKMSKSRLKKLAGNGVGVKLTVEGLDGDFKPVRGKKPNVALEPNTSTMSDDAKSFLDGLAQTTKAEGQIASKLGRCPTTAQKLGGEAQELQSSLSTELATESAAKRNEVQNELGAAKLVLGVIGDQCDKASSAAVAFLKGISAAVAEVEAAGVEPDGAKPEKKDKDKPKPKKDSGGGDAKPAKPSKPAGGDDFNP